MVLAIFIQLIGATLFGFIVAATRRIMQFIGPIEKANNRNLQEIAVSDTPYNVYFYIYNAICMLLLQCMCLKVNSSVLVKVAQ
jgi:hypothetical protein